VNPALPSHSALDDAVAAACAELDAAGVPKPQAIFLMAAGAGLLAERLQDPGAFPLGRLPDVPEPWRERTLFHGRLVGERGELAAWVLEDVAGEPGGWTLEPGWAAGYPCWLAAEGGARLCVHTAAGAALPSLDPGTGLGDAGQGPAVGSLALVSDHINLSGDSPLVAIGESRLGPLFPDLTRLHHRALRHAALRRAERLGIAACEVVAACTQGPSLETPAEARWLAHAGAQVALQGVAAPYLAAAHAGLALLGVCAVTSAGGPIDVAQLVAQSQAAAPALEDLLVALADEISAAARELRTDASL
jgi:purine-nucleoside phosphorylase